MVVTSLSGILPRLRSLTIHDSSRLKATNFARLSRHKTYSRQFGKGFALDLRNSLTRLRMIERRA